MVQGKLNLLAFLQTTSSKGPEHVLCELRRASGTLCDSALTQRDYSMPNVTANGGFGFVDCGIAGIANIHSEFMAKADRFAMNCGAEWVPAFYQAYAIAQPDRERICSYALLNAFFAHYEP